MVFISIDTDTATQVSLVFDTEPALFMASVHALRRQENLNKSEEAGKCEFCSGSTLEGIGSR